MNKTDIEKEFIATIKQYERVIYKVCTFYISNEHPLTDLYQEVICNMWVGFPKFRNESAVSTWIYRIALNTCISGLRKSKTRPQSTSIQGLEEMLPNPENMDEQIKELYKLIYQLKELDRALILLYLEDKSYKEIAEITGLSVANVATKLKRTREKLRDMSNH